MFECTQKLECTQDINSQSISIRECPEQIGFLGICGNKYPVKKGPNKIGRDPQTCNIVLNLNSISRQHAVINVLNKKGFMLMDLDSANKTKLLGKSLIPYVPQPLKNGDMVQFGEIFGIFRLFEEEDDLPMTQALPMTQVMIPDTPVHVKHISKLNSALTVPESPDVSDKEDSFIIASQPNKPQFNSANTHFVKPGKTISIQPVGGNKIDNIFWNSSKKSTSMMNDSTSSLNNSKPMEYIREKENEVNASNIHEMETQEVPPTVKDIDPIFEANTQLPDSPLPSIYSANTQLPGSNTASPSIYTANTQLPLSNNASPNIYTANTQLPMSGAAPSIYTVNTQLPTLNGSPSIYTANTQLPLSNNASPSIHMANTQLPEGIPSSIHNLSTQLPPDENLPEVCKINEQQDMQIDLCTDKNIYDANTQMFPPLSPVKNKTPHKPSTDSKLDRSDEMVVFDEMDSQPDDENFESQALLTENILGHSSIKFEESEPLSQIALPKSAKRNRIDSGSSTDCDDNDDVILLSQKKDKRVNEKQVTGEEDATDCEDEMIELKIDKKIINTAEALDLEEVATQVIEVIENPLKGQEILEDLLTQVIPADEKICADKVDSKEMEFEELPTQVLADAIPPSKVINKICLVSDEVEISPFKVPLKSAFRAKKKDVTKSPTKKKDVVKPIENVEKNKLPVEDDKYYQLTQDLFEDLCTQTQSPGSSPAPVNKNTLVSSNETSPNDIDLKIDNFIANLSSQEVRHVIGAEKNVAPIKKVSSFGSDSSDLECTPKKIRPCKFMDIDLPDSQEIKTVVSQAAKSIVTESSSDSENEMHSEDQCTPILFRKKPKPKSSAKMDLTKKFDADALPSRVITRVRKPTSKIQELDGKKSANSILQPKFLTEQDDDVDSDIITENITRLKTKNDKTKTVKDSSKTDIKQVEQNKIPDVRKEIKDQISLTTKVAPIVRKTPPDDIKNKEVKENAENACNEMPDIIKDIKTNTKSSKTTPKEEPAKTRESRRKNKTSPIDAFKDISKDVVVTDKTVEVNKSDIVIDSKRSTRKAASKGSDEKSHGPIIIEAHTLHIPVKERKKREYKRKNKETAPKNNKEEKLDNKSDSKTENEKRPVRSTRGKKKSEDPYTETIDEKRKTKTKDSPEKEIRRSKRQKTVKESNDVNVTKEPVIKSILKKSIHEQSTVYNLSSGSNSDTPNLKRPAEIEIEQPVPKRTRAASRATPSRKNKPCYVLFTAFPYEEVKSKLENLGAIIVTDVTQCSVLLTLKIRRTFKLLCAVGLGKPIVGPSWVQACADTNMIVDPWLYTIKDEAAETRFKFTLQRTLVGPRAFLKGYNVSSTPSVLPQASEMKLIVQCSGGNWQEGGRHWLCLSSAADRALWPALRDRGAILVTTELILGGVLRQTLEIDANRIKVP